MKPTPTQTPDQFTLLRSFNQRLSELEARLDELAAIIQRSQSQKASLAALIQELEKRFEGLLQQTSELQTLSKQLVELLNGCATKAQFDELKVRAEKLLPLIGEIKVLKESQRGHEERIRKIERSQPGLNTAHVQSVMPR